MAKFVVFMEEDERVVVNADNINKIRTRELSVDEEVEIEVDIDGKTYFFYAKCNDENLVVDYLMKKLNSTQKYVVIDLINLEREYA